MPPPNERHVIGEATSPSPRGPSSAGTPSSESAAPRARTTSRSAANGNRLVHLERQLQEAFDALWAAFVDPREAYDDAVGGRWTPLAATGGKTSAPFADPVQLAAVRDECRALALSNEFAINGHENRISYLVGSGHTYRAQPCAGRNADAALLAAVQSLIDAFVERNAWRRRQQEIVRRKDRDGECFLRFFPGADGVLAVRFVEPDQVAAPRALLADPAVSFGVRTAPGDVETPLEYFIDGEGVPAAEIQHRKANVDANVKRGLPLFYPVRKNLLRAEKILRNMSVVSEIQSAIALIRKHVGATAAGLEQFLNDQCDASFTHPASGRATHYRRYAPGTILDASAGMEYEFPAAGLDAARYVAVLQAELRAVAARLVMPEFMLTSDASNANYSSTLVAEGPAVRMFERLQHELVEEDLEVMRRAVDYAIDEGCLPLAAREDVVVAAMPPRLAVRNRLEEARADEILVRARAMSPQTMARRHGLDPDEEQRLWQMRAAE